MSTVWMRVCLWVLVGCQSPGHSFIRSSEWLSANSTKGIPNYVCCHQSLLFAYAGEQLLSKKSNNPELCPNQNKGPGRTT